LGPSARWHRPRSHHSCAAAPPCAALRHLTAARGPGRSLPSGPNRGTRQQRSRDRDRVRRGPAPPGAARPRHAARRHQRCRARRQPSTQAATGTLRRAARSPAAHTAAHATPGEAAAAHRGASPPPGRSAPSGRSPATAQRIRTDRATSRARGGAQLGPPIECHARCRRRPHLRRRRRCWRSRGGVGCRCRRRLQREQKAAMPHAMSRSPAWAGVAGACRAHLCRTRP
jgi:hypothetical protein